MRSLGSWRYFLKRVVELRDDPVVKSTGYSCRGPGFSSQMVANSPPYLHFQRIQPLLISDMHMAHMHTCRQAFVHIK